MRCGFRLRVRFRIRAKVRVRVRFRVRLRVRVRVRVFFTERCPCSHARCSAAHPSRNEENESGDARRCSSRSTVATSPIAAASATAGSSRSLRCELGVS